MALGRSPLPQGAEPSGSLLHQAASMRKPGSSQGPARPRGLHKCLPSRLQACLSLDAPHPPAPPSSLLRRLAYLPPAPALALPPLCLECPSRDSQGLSSCFQGPPAFLTPSPPQSTTIIGHTLYSLALSSPPLPQRTRLFWPEAIL